MHFSTTPTARNDRFDIYCLRIRHADVRKIAASLIRSGGEHGYGNMYDMVRSHFGNALDKIASGKGL